MNVFGWAANLLSPSTPLPSGAIDVVAVRHADGTLSCSPFHVKLGKICKKGEKLIVKLRVNGQEIDVFMRLGPAGEAFFLKSLKEGPERDREALMPDDIMAATDKQNTAGSSIENSSLSFEPESKQIVRPRSFSEGNLTKTGRELRDRSTSDMSNYQNLAISTSPMPTILTCDPVFKAEIVDKPSMHLGANVSYSLEKPFEEPNKREYDSSWIWRWGYLPVKSSSNLQLAHENTAEGKSMSHNVKNMNVPVGQETRETADEWMAGSTTLSSEALEVVESLGQEQASSKLKKNVERRTNLEYRLCDMDEIDGSSRFEERQELTAGNTSRNFRALSLCGSKLNDPNRPGTLQDLHNILLEHRVTEEMFRYYAGDRQSNLLDDKDLVVIADDYLLNFETAKTVLARLGSDPTYNQESGNRDILEEAGCELSLDDSLVHEVIERMKLQHNNSESQILPSWIGVKLSNWEKYIKTTPIAQNLDNKGACGKKLDSLAIESDSIESEDKVTDIKPNYLSLANNSSFWNTLGIGWRESFTDLVSAYRLQQQQIQRSLVQSSFSSPEKIGQLDGDAGDDYFQQDLGRSSEELELSRGDMSSNLLALKAAANSSLISEGDNSVENRIVPLDSEVIDSIYAERDAFSHEEDCTDHDQVSLQDIAFEDISPEPPDGDFYESDTDSYFSLDDDEVREDKPSVSFYGGATKGSDAKNGKALNENKSSSAEQENVISGSKGVGRRKFRRYRYKKVLVPSNEQLQRFQLREGRNELAFEFEDCPPLIAQLFLWPENAKIVVTDVEGVLATGSKINSPGGVWSSLFDSYIGQKPTLQTNNVSDAVNLFRYIAKQGYRVLYIANTISMTSNNTSNSKFSHCFLNNIQNELGQRLPEGPVFKSPDSLMQAFGPSRTDVFKAAALRGLRSLFPTMIAPYHAAFVSKENDVIALERNGFPDGRIFLSDGLGKLRRILQNRSHSFGFRELNEIALQVFPKVQDGKLTPFSTAAASPILNRIATESISKEDAATNGSMHTTSNRVNMREEVYSDVNYWRIPLPLVDDPL